MVKIQKSLEAATVIDGHSHVLIPLIEGKMNIAVRGLDFS